MPTLPIKTTAPGVANSFDEVAQVPQLVLVKLWSMAEPHRIGEVALLPPYERRLLGRGDVEIEKFQQFAQHRPGGHVPVDPHEGLLTGGSISRRQLLVRATAVEIEVERVGKCVMLVNGVETESACLKPGDTLMLRGELLLQCVRREANLPSPPGAFIHAFGEPDAFDIVGESAVVWGLRTLLYAAARTNGHVYLHGESGTGKELAARAIHQQSPRASGPYVSHNASNSTSSLLEWQLFGNLRNCPNQGMPARKGIVPSADGGTLFLDEIGDLTPEAQAQLLRVIASGESTPVGGDVPQRVDVRFVAATNKPESVLRSDLPARFLVGVGLPTLRERAEDIPLIARQWILAHARERPEEARRFIYAGPSGRPEVRISARLIEHLVREPPPLNVRGLHKLLWVAMQGSPGDKVRLPKAFPAPAAPAPTPSAAAPASTLSAPAERRTPPPPSTDPPKEADSDSPSKEQIVARLELERGNVARAARALGLERSALYRRMQRYGIAREESEP